MSSEKVKRGPLAEMIGLLSGVSKKRRGACFGQKSGLFSSLESPDGPVGRNRLRFDFVSYSEHLKPCGKKEVIVYSENTLSSLKDRMIAHR